MYMLEKKLYVHIILGIKRGNSILSYLTILCIPSPEEYKKIKSVIT